MLLFTLVSAYLPRLDDVTFRPLSAAEVAPRYEPDAGHLYSPPLNSLHSKLAANAPGKFPHDSVAYAPTPDL
jgi:hypothetical protein